MFDRFAPITPSCPSRVLRSAARRQCGSFVAAAFVAMGFASMVRAQCTAALVPGISTPGTSGDVYALAIAPSGELILGGAFAQANGASANRVARYNPNGGAWSTLGAGINVGPFVFALAALPNGDIMVGGQFTQAGGGTVSNIARHTTSGSWSNVGGGANNIVASLVVLPGGDVIAGGLFTTMSTVSASCIARYNPATGVWLPLGAGTNNLVSALAVLPGGDLLVGGQFTEADGVVDRFRIASCNPATGVWLALGEGVNGPVNALAVLPGGDFIVGGQFTQAGGFSGVAASNIARYNPTTGSWSALTAGTNGAVSAIVVIPGGNILVGGSFTSAGGQTRQYITRYNPGSNTWSTLSGVASGAVASLALMSGGDVFLGGAFPGRIARYYPGPQAPTIAGQPLSVAACASSSAMFSITASGSPGTGPPSYLWYKGANPLNTLTNPSAATPTLLLTNVQAGDAASYTCRVTNACGGLNATSNAAALTLCGAPANPCPADFNGVGGVTVADIFGFLTAWFAGCP